DLLGFSDFGALARRVISKNSGTEYNQRYSSRRRFLLNSFSERSAMAPRYTIATKKAPNPIDSARRQPRAHAPPKRLIRAFMRVDNAAVRRRIVELVEEIAGDLAN